MSNIDLSNAQWRKSTFSNNGGDCVELAEVSAPGHSKARNGHVIAMRDSKNPEGPALVYSRSEIRALVLGAKAGEFDDLI